MELTRKNQCFDFLKRYGYHLVQEDSENCITYIGNKNKISIIYSEYSNEIYCMFEDIRTRKSFSLQDALDYLRINHLKGMYQISKKEDLYKGLSYMSDVIEKVYSTVDLSNIASFNEIYDYTIKKRNKALEAYSAKEDIKKADSFWMNNNYVEARRLYMKNIGYLSKMQLKKLEICKNKIKDIQNDTK